MGKSHQDSYLTADSCGSYREISVMKGKNELKSNMLMVHSVRLQPLYINKIYAKLLPPPFLVHTS